MAGCRSRTGTFCQSYRRVRANVQDHLTSTYAENSLPGNVDMQENTNCSFGRLESESECKSTNTGSSVTSECDIAEYETVCASSPNISEHLIPDRRNENGNIEQDLERQNLFFILFGQ